jgi:membrane-bound serine protease (ClpP class)
MNLAPVLILLGLATGWAVESNAPPPVPAATRARRVCVIPVREELVSSELARWVKKSVQAAFDQKADLLILDIETVGGRLEDCREIVASVARFRGQTVSFVNTRAAGGGVWVALAAQRIYMAPESQIGAMGMTMVPNLPAPNPQVQPIISAVLSLVSATAVSNGHNPEVVAAMLDSSRGLVLTNIMGGVAQPVTLAKPGELLSLNAAEAAKEYGQPPRRLLSSGTAANLDDLLNQLGYGNAVRLPNPRRIGRWSIFWIGWASVFALLGIIAALLRLLRKARAPAVGH